MGFFFEKLMLKPKTLFLLDMFLKKTNETVAINRFQRSRLTFDLSAKVAHIGVP